MAEKPEIKNGHSTQIIEKLSEVQSPIHDLNQSQIIKIANQFELSPPIKYIEGGKCLNCLLAYAKDLEIDGRNFKIVPSRNALRIYTE